MVFIAFDHKPVVEQCRDCKKVCHGWCVAYINPEGKWKNGRCPLCTTRTEGNGTQTTKKKLNPLKAAAGKGGLKPYVYKRGKYEKGDTDRTAPKVKR